jgi:hypothetical protein
MFEPHSDATVASIEAATYRITVATEDRRQDRRQVTYGPERLHGITAYREISRDFAQGDRIQFTSTNRELGVSNRDLGAFEMIDGKQIDVKMDGEKERTVSFDSAKMRHFERLSRDLAQFTGTHHRAGIGEHGHHSSPGTHQHSFPLCIRFGYRPSKSTGRTDRQPANPDPGATDDETAESTRGMTYAVNRRPRRRFRCPGSFAMTPKSKLGTMPPFKRRCRRKRKVMNMEA